LNNKRKMINWCTSSSSIN